MSQFIYEWVNSVLKLSTHVDSFEKQFRNGYLFGEVLYELKQIDNTEDFQNSNSVAARIRNFTTLEPVMRALGVRFSTRHMQDVMDGREGAALRVLCQLKSAVEVQSSQSLLPDATTGRAGPLRSIAATRPQFDAHQRRFVEQRIKTLTMPPTQARMDKYLKRFDEEKLKQEKNAAEEKTRETDVIKSQRHMFREAQIAGVRKNQLFLQVQLTGADDNAVSSYRLRRRTDRTD
eukprot:GHVQ01024517.1.p1 GENE.GHVQ01024517.1~~GHVQ01024517.1.p1  ORF type:complete len:233 (-),score=36.44 GHVQ01024517.1:269-967(-)